MKAIAGRSAVCSKCDQPIALYKNARGRWVPCNPDGSDHFDQCSRAVMARVMRDGLYFSNKDAAGYEYRGRVKFVRLSKESVRGSRYVPDGCDCGLPPWELCEEVCQHAIQP
jgi:hypothetical protein